MSADRNLETKGRRRLRFASGYVPAGLVLIGSLVLFVSAGQALLRLPGIPYNLRELLDSGSTGFTLTSLGLCLLITGATPLFLARSWDLQPPYFAWLAPLNCVAVASLVYALVRRSVPWESIGDIIGSPVLELPAEVESLGRFVGLYVGILVFLTVGVRLTIGRPCSRRDLPGLLSLSLLGMLSYLIVIVYACTDNVIELLRGEGNLAAVTAISAFLSLLGLTAGAISLAVIRATEGRWMPSAGASIILVLSVPLGWVLLLVATTPALTKYGQTFAAREFLLGPDRTQHLGDRVLFLRFALAVGTTIGALSIGMLIGRLALRPTRSSPVSSRPQSAKFRSTVPLGRGHYLLLASLYVGFTVYGSLVPLRMQAVPWGEAWERFRQIPFWQLSLDSRSDWLANILLFVPLGFLLAGALHFDRLGRFGDWVAALLIVPACTLLSAALELTQIWFPHRTVSQNDIAAETLGAIVGVGLWSVAGRWGTDLAYHYIRMISSNRKLASILLLYVTILLVNSLMPLDLTISLTHLGLKYREGKILLFAINSGNPMESAYEAFVKTATFVPVGLLTAALLPRLATVRGNLTRGLIIGVSLAAVIESIQLLVYSQVTNGADLLWGGIGGVLGTACLDAVALSLAKYSPGDPRRT